MSRLDLLLYPQLRTLPAGERADALRKARSTAFDVVELVGIAVSLVLVTALTRYGAQGWNGFERIAAAALNFAFALPLLGILMGPFLVRRVRRGLDELLGRRGGE